MWASTYLIETIGKKSLPLNSSLVRNQKLNVGVIWKWMLIKIILGVRIYFLTIEIIYDVVTSCVYEWTLKPTFKLPLNLLTIIQKTTNLIKCPTDLFVQVKVLDVFYQYFHADGPVWHIAEEKEWHHQNSSHGGVFQPFASSITLGRLLFFVLFPTNQ